MENSNPHPHTPGSATDPAAPTLTPPAGPRRRLRHRAKLAVAVTLAATTVLALVGPAHRAAPGATTAAPLPAGEHGVADTHNHTDGHHAGGHHSASNPLDADLEIPLASLPAPEIRVVPDSDVIEIQSFADPLSLDRFPGLHRSATLGTDRIRVWVCAVPANTTNPFYAQFNSRHTSRVPHTPQSVTTWLAANITPWFTEASGGRYTTAFEAAGTISLGRNDGPHDCYFEAIRRTGAPASNVLAIDNIPYGGGVAGPGLIEIGASGTQVSGATLSTPPNQSRRGAYVGGGTIPGGAGVVIHEIGHTLHWPHSLNGNNEYGNAYDVMSDARSARHTLAWNRYNAGWIPANQVHIYNGAATTLNLNRPGTAGTQMVVLRDANTNVLTTLEARPATGRDSSLPRGGVVAHTIDLRPCRELSALQLPQCISLWRSYRQVAAGTTSHVIAAGQSRHLTGVNISVAAAPTASGFTVTLNGGAPAPTTPFVDVPRGSYYEQATLVLRDRGITTGYGGSNRFEPMLNVSRAEMAAFLWRMAGRPASSASCGWADGGAIPSWARTASCWLRDNGITTGFGGSNRYEPARNVSRAEMAAFLWRFAGQPRHGGSCGFTDQGAIPGWARTPACWLRTNGITTNNPYRPGDLVTRAEMAAFLFRTGGTLGYW